MQPTAATGLRMRINARTDGRSGVAKAKAYVTSSRAKTIRMPLHASATATSSPLKVRMLPLRDTGNAISSNTNSLADAEAVCSGIAICIRIIPGTGTRNARTIHAGINRPMSFGPAAAANAPISASTTPPCHKACFDPTKP